LIVVSFGGPEGPDDVLPFLENVTRGRGVPRERLEEVAENYAMFGGVSPINAQNRALIAALEAELERRGPRLPVYFGNRNWHPFLADTLARMADDGVRRALAFVTSAYASYSGCRQYLENIEAARREVGTAAPVIDKLRTFHDHPGFIEPMALNVARALGSIAEPERAAARVVFTAHSLPVSMAQSSDYVAELDEAAQLVAERVGLSAYERAYQSRSGPPTQPWLEPDILACLDRLAAEGARDVVVMPFGFISDHMEVVFDLDFQAKRHADSLGLRMIRAETVGTAPPFVSMIRELVLERIEPGRERRGLGTRGTRADVCAPDCCPAPQRPQHSQRHGSQT
jgi:ferrochelatase